MKSLYTYLEVVGCVNHCQHCYVSTGEHSFIRSLGNCKKVIKGIKEFTSEAGITCAGFSLFMEPTMHPQILELLAFLRNAGYPVRWMNTNGHGLAVLPEMATKLRAAGLNGVCFTLYGLAKAHDWFARRKGAFNDIVKASDYCREAGISVTWAYLIQKKIIGELDTLRKMVKGTGLYGWEHFTETVGTIHPDGCARQITHLVADTDDAEQIADHLEELDGQKDESARLDSEANLIWKIKQDPAGPAETGDTIHLDRQGDVYPFDHERNSDYLLGNIEKDGWPAIMERFYNAEPRGMARQKELRWEGLAEKYGDPKGKELHNFFTVRRKWVQKALVNG